MSTQDLATVPPDASDEAKAPPFKYEPLGTARTILVVAYLAIAIWYLAWRPSTFNPSAMTFSIVLYAAELFGFVAALMHIFMVWRLTVRESATAPAGLTVDVFITTFDEPVAMVRRTLLAAQRMDYPHQTWLLDDGSRTQMRDLAEELQCRYLSRPQNIDAKAGNLNNALKHSRAEFVAVFDADHATARDFLSRTLGYFRDNDVAFVQTPQDFYNLDSYQHRRSGRQVVWTEQSLFFRIIQRGKDYWNAAFFCGSCAVLRRRALDEVKGFATKTVTEDLETSVRFHRKGFRSVYHAQSLAFGVAPSTAAPFLKQRVRWGQGAMQSLRNGGILFGRGLTAAQRVCYLATVATYFDGWQKAVFYVAPVIVLTTGVMPIAELSWQFLAHFIPFYILTFWTFEEVGRGFGRSINIEQYNMARFAAFVWSTSGLVRRNLRFRVTQKTGGAAEESRRWVLPQGLVFLLNLIAIPFGILLTWAHGSLPTGALVANLVWALVNVSLARAVLGFTARLSSFKRREYRFPIPVAARLAFSTGEPVIGVLDNLSSQGFKFYGRFPREIQTGARLAGELYLPSGKLPFTGDVRSLIHSERPEDHLKAIGCSFEWKRETDRDRLSAFLYGSDLQWRLNQFVEQGRTPIDRMAELTGRRERPGRPETVRWAAALISPAGMPPDVSQVALISVPRVHVDQRTLVSFQRVSTDQEQRVDIITRAGTRVFEGQCDFVETLSGGGMPLHVYRFHVRRLKAGK
jgi:cellulose synthase (UDP-forming)